jgi:hypothetical protein
MFLADSTGGRYEEMGQALPCRARRLSTAAALYKFEIFCYATCATNLPTKWIRIPKKKSSHSMPSSTVTSFGAKCASPPLPRQAS